MIKNIIFDMGNVLVRFHPEETAARLVQGEDRNLLQKHVFAEEWKLLDRGTISQEEAIQRVCARLPEHLKEPARYIIEHQIETLTPIEESYRLVKELKAKGYGVYLLSNVSVQFHDFWKEIPALHLMDGKIISADLKIVKPEKAIYNALFETYRLNPEECFFVDDLPQNIEGGKQLLMDGYCFHGDVMALRRALSGQGVTVDLLEFVPVTEESQITTLAELAHEIWNQHFVPLIGQEQVDYMLEKFQSYSAMKEQLEHGGYQYYLSIYGKKPVGYTGVKPEPDRRKLFLSKLYLKKEYRGRGFARQAVEFLVSQCQKQGLNGIWLTVNRYNSNTIAAYDKMGFEKIREQVSDIGNGFVMDDYVMEKPVEISSN